MWLCVRQLKYSSMLSGQDMEVVVVHEGGLLPLYSWCRVIRQPNRTTGELFNKPRLQNVGIEAARGDVLTFVDADAIVADFFFQAAEFATSPRITKVCYRVRRLPEDFPEVVRKDSGAITKAFDRYDHYDDWAHEGYGLPEIDAPGGMPVFGNSHFSITREKLGDLRFNEAYAGAGFEDIWMNREIWRHYGERYSAAIFTDGDHAVFSIRNQREADWWDTNQNTKNRELYRRT